jgi:hypothetical protein
VTAVGFDDGMTILPNSESRSQSNDKVSSFQPDLGGYLTHSCIHKHGGFQFFTAIRGRINHHRDIPVFQDANCFRGIRCQPATGVLHQTLGCINSLRESDQSADGEWFFNFCDDDVETTAVKANGDTCCEVTPSPDQNEGGCTIHVLREGFIF